MINSSSLELLAAADGWPPFLYPPAESGLASKAFLACNKAMHTPDWQRIDAPREGEATSFDLHSAGIAEQGFVVRFRGQLYAYLNRCPHAGSPLDWVPGRFFSADGRHLACHTHGALFAPESGDCLAGPCPHGLTVLPLHHQGGQCLVPRQLDSSA